MNADGIPGVIEAAPKRRVVWMRPTAYSPLCRYEIAPRSQKATSSCGIWVSIILRALARENPGADACPLCATGRRVQEVKS